MEGIAPLSVVMKEIIGDRKATFLSWATYDARLKGSPMRQSRVDEEKMATKLISKIEIEDVGERCRCRFVVYYSPALNILMLVGPACFVAVGNFKAKATLKLKPQG